jgi:hypothetical protein
MSSRTLTFTTAVSLALICLAVAAVQPAQASGISAQTTATPTPTPTAVVVQDGMQPSAEFYQNKAKVQEFFDGILEWFDSVDTAIAGFDTLVANIVALASGDGITVNGEVYSLNGMIEQISDALALAFVWRCYTDSPIIPATLVFFSWVLFVNIIRFVIMAVPYILQIVSFVWGKIVDLWQSIPFM